MYSTDISLGGQNRVTTTVRIMTMNFGNYEIIFIKISVGTVIGADITSHNDHVSLQPYTYAISQE